MYLVNLTKNQLSKLETRSFTKLQIREREQFQEWLVDTPEALGEELLIIQKEFDGFDGTRERLDLLALDKDGRLVIIENKLDDSGRNVAWQAIKYAAYCSTLKKSEIVSIYQKYLDGNNKLDGNNNQGSATQLICEFLGKEDFDEIVLNPGNQQRLMLVAVNFRKEVTSPALWLLGHGIRVQCFKVTLFSHDEALFIDIQKIIPTPEAADFMIKMAEKETEETAAQGGQRRSYTLRLSYWEQLLEHFQKQKNPLFRGNNPSELNYLNTPTGVPGCRYGIAFSQVNVRAELLLARSNPEENKWLFDRLHNDKKELEQSFGGQLEWDRLDSLTKSRIQISKAFDGYEEENWSEMIKWHEENIKKLEDVFSKPLKKLEVPQGL